MLPTIAGDGTHRVIRVQGTISTRTTLGPVTIRGVRITNGLSVHKPGDPGLGCGGGLAIVDVDQVKVEQCVFTGNRTQAAPVSGWPEADRVAFRQAVLDILDAIFTPTTEAALNLLIQAVNLVKKPPLPPVSRAAILAAASADFDRAVTSGRPNHAITAQAFGAGVAAVWSSPTIDRCLLTGNVANGRGGAIAVAGYGWPTITGCIVDKNSTLVGGRCDGGGIGCEVAVPDKLGRDLFEIDIVRFLVTKLAGVKSSIGSPLSVLSSISVQDVIDYGRWLLDPLLPNPVVRGIPMLLLDAIHLGQAAVSPAPAPPPGSPKPKSAKRTLLDHALYYVVTTALSLNAWDAWDRSQVAKARTSVITIAKTRVSANHGYDDGGGVYASVLSRVSLASCVIADNRAENMGGGVRLTMGSDATITGCRFTGNASGPGGPRSHDHGGALAVRNVDLVVSDTVFGARSAGRSGVPSPSSNVSGDAAGGAIAIEAASEGDMAGVPDMWTSILVEVFATRSVTVALGAGCVIGANAAGFTAAKRAIPGAQHAKGGGLFALRGDFPDAPALSLTIESVRSTIVGNLAQTTNYLSAVRPGLRVSSSHEIALQDLSKRTEVTENSWNSNIDSSGRLTF
ncbi:right-handed parallel beta-helix repeat-containing protein [Leifsonia sp. fls2-241-R2A-40a]|uniref:right-handed parallel beta-helix repeat-containing protein n=1 Tax=Leifsonia sp. fls2-241-R2A-40a TaxID=3040290 RepID=UPI00254CB981|nr:right-handed parallel beta-helix repeat-containing protein [Leifsonia sp. fls2-241-R2A-40a]